MTREGFYWDTQAQAYTFDRLTSGQVKVLRFARDEGVVSGGANTSGRGSVHHFNYSTCASLERHGMLKGRLGNDGSRWYSITDAGKAALEAS